MIYLFSDQSKLNNLLMDLGYDGLLGSQSPQAGSGAAVRMEAAATEDQNNDGEGFTEGITGAGTERHPAGAVTAGQDSCTPQEETDNNNAGERSRQKTSRKIILKKAGHSLVKPKPTKRMSSVDQTKIEPLDSVEMTDDDPVKMIVDGKSKKKARKQGKLKRSKCKHCTKMITSCNMSKHVKRLHSNELQQPSNEPVESSGGGESRSGEFNCCFCHKTLRDR